MSPTDLLSLMIRASLLMAAGYFVAGLLSWKSAAIAHRVLVTTLGCCLALPLIAMMMPGWNWIQPKWISIFQRGLQSEIDVQGTELKTSGPTIRDVLPNPNSPDPMTSDLTAWFEYVDERTDSVPDDISADVNGLLKHDHRVEGTFGPPAAADVVVSAYVSQSYNASVRNSWNWLSSCVAGWLVVSGLLTGRLLYALVELFRFVHGCSAASPEVTRHVECVATRLQINRSVRVILSSPDAMPMACWPGRWILVLPSNFPEWSSTMKETTLVHELGHIVRRDAWSDLVAQCVFCAFWLNPFSWLSRQLLRRLRERACDEWALQKSAIDVRTYAQCLLDVVQRCQTPQLQIASAMAGKQDLESRLRWLMSASRPRVDRPIFTTAMVVAIGCMGLTIATAQPTQPPTSTSREQSAVNTDSLEPLNKVIISEEPSPPDPSISVSGIVIDTNGNPLNEIEVVLCEKATTRTSHRTTLKRFPDVLARTTTNNRGRFAFDKIGIPPRMTDTIANLRAGVPGATLLIRGPGKALAWEPVQSYQDPEKKIRLSPEADITGIVVDDSGKPVENAELTVHAFTHRKNYVNEDFDDAGDLNLSWSDIRIGTTTNNGKFRIPNLPQNYRIAVICTGDNGGRSYFYIDTDLGDNETIRYQFPSSRSEVTVHRNPLTVSLTPRARAKILVHNQNGRPVTGGIIEAIDEDRGFGGMARVNSSGIALLGVRKSGIHKVRYTSDPLAPSIGIVQSVDIQPVESQVLKMQLAEHKWLTGKVIDKDTGAGVVGAYVWGWQIDATGAGSPNSTENLVVSGDDGVFRMPVVAGEWKLQLYGSVDGYFDDDEFSQSMRVGSENSVNVTVSEEHVPDDVMIKLGRGLIIDGVLTDFDGKPQAGVIVKAESEGSRGRKAATLTDKAGRFHFSGFSPYKAVQISSWTESGSAEHVIYRHRDQKSANRLIENIELEMYSGATLTGRVMKNGTPAQNITVRVKKSLPINAVPDKFQMISEKTTNEVGNYTFNGLLKGDTYEIEIDAPGHIEIRDMRRPYGTTVKSHATIYMPDVRLLTNQQKLSGKVIDPDGNPVPGITVAASLRILGDIACPAKGEPPWNTSDKEGRFSLTDLPDEPITLMAHRWPLAGGPINYLVKVHPELNATDIQIVYDPKRDSGGEQLDAK
jgi:beta-lactamase regulating signal transducer with metallopeptidase domain/protocatechuate 3,4-dioxygenase beta subunit